MRKSNEQRTNTGVFPILLVWTMLLMILVCTMFTLPVCAFQSPYRCKGASKNLFPSLSPATVSQPSFTLSSCSLTTTTFSSSTTLLFSSQNTKVNKYTDEDDDDNRFSRDVRLREEAESPFRKVRYFFYFNIAGGATTSLLISISRIVAAVVSNVNTDLLDESVRNALIDVGGLMVVGYLWRQDQRAEGSRLKRATKGATLAKLKVRASRALIKIEEDDDTTAATNGTAVSTTFITTLASFRRQRGIEKRVVIAAGGKNKIQQVIREAQELQLGLADNDLVVIPVVMPPSVAMTSYYNNFVLDDATTPPDNVALPVGNDWKMLLEDEAAEASSQGVDIEQEGFCIVLKKNGKVGQRTKGTFLRNLLNNVVARKEAGMDVVNI